MELFSFIRFQFSHSGVIKEESKIVVEYEKWIIRQDIREEEE